MKELVTYELEKDSFCVQVFRIKSRVSELSREVTLHARRIDSTTVKKLHCMYLAGRKLSYPNVDTMLRVRAILLVRINRCLFRSERERKLASLRR